MIKLLKPKIVYTLIFLLNSLQFLEFYFFVIFNFLNKFTDCKLDIEHDM